MHGFIRKRLEDLLMAKRVSEGATGERSDAVDQHLASCGECADEISMMRAHSDLLRSFRVPEEVEPAAGFYARVLQRIEEHAKGSIWAVFIYSPYGKRLAFASATLALLLASFVVAQESRDGHLMGENLVAQDIHTVAPVTGDQSEQRDAVLVNLVSYEGSTQ
jgi:anti-sigma factor RsiW